MEVWFEITMSKTILLELIPSARSDFPSLALLWLTPWNNWIRIVKIINVFHFHPFFNLMRRIYRYKCMTFFKILHCFGIWIILSSDLVSKPYTKNSFCFDHCSLLPIKLCFIVPHFRVNNYFRVGTNNFFC